MSPPWGLPLPKVWNLLVTISDQKYVCEGFFPWTVFINEEHDVVSPVSHCPCQTGWLRSCFCPISTKPLDQRLIFFFETTGAVANSWNCAWGNCGTFFPTFEHLKKLTSESEDTWVTRWTTLQLVWHLYVTFVQPSRKAGTSSKRLFHLLGVEQPQLNWGTSGEIAISRWGATWGPVLKCTVFGTYQTSVDRLVG